MKLLYGKPIADKILDRLKNDIAMQEEKPGLAVILVGDNEASQMYVSLKEKTADKIGMVFFRFNFSEDVPENEIIEHIKKLNNDANVHGIIVQLPLPEGFDTKKIIANIDSKKDADGFFYQSESISGEDEKGRIWPVFPHAIFKLAKSSDEKIKEKKAIIIANSNEFGQTMKKVLAGKNISASYIISSSVSQNIDKIKEADMVISAVGSPGLLTGKMLKDGAIVIDGGIERVGGKVMGDVDFSSIKDKNGFIAPVPGGVGPLTIAYLLENVYLEFKAQQKDK